MTFRQLHQQKEPLLICNVWDVASAQLAEQTGFQALGTSSAAIARMLGYQDGIGLTFPDVLYLVQRIAANTNLPLTVDLESGYSRDPFIILQHIMALADLGVAGINLEDSVVVQDRQLCDKSSFARTLETLKNALLKAGIDVFINVRTDTFLLGHTQLLEETLERVHLYEKAGADGIFIPGIAVEEDIRAVTSATRLPLNVMCLPALPGFDKLQEIGVKRISMGNFLFEKMYRQFRQSLHLVKSQATFSSVFNHAGH